MYENTASGSRRRFRFPRRRPQNRPRRAANAAEALLVPGVARDHGIERGRSGDAGRWWRAPACKWSNAALSAAGRLDGFGSFVRAKRPQRVSALLTPEEATVVLGNTIGTPQLLNRGGRGGRSPLDGPVSTGGGMP